MHVKIKNETSENRLTRIDSLNFLRIKKLLFLYGKYILLHL